LKDRHHRRREHIVTTTTGTIDGHSFASEPDPVNTVACSSDAADILAAGRLAYVAIETTQGPLVTPVLYAVAAGRVWFVTNRHALKSKVLRKRSRTSCAVRVGDRAVVITGRARLLSLSHPGDFFTSPAHLARLPLALSSWATRNPRQVLGFVLDAPSSPRQVLPQNVVLVEVVPESVQVVAHDPSQDLSNRASAALPSGTSRSRRLRAALPESLAGLVHCREGVLGIATVHGPVAVPVLWDHRRQVAILPSGVQPVAGSAPACLTLDEPVHARPTEQRGIALRGSARELETHAESENLVGFDTERITYWSGFHAATTSLERPRRQTT